MKRFWRGVKLPDFKYGSLSSTKIQPLLPEEEMRPRPAEKIPSDPDALIELIRDAGVVDLGGSAFPTHARLSEARSSGVQTLVLNGCESEPFVTADHVLMLNHPVEILKGAELMRLASGADRAVIAVEDNKMDAAELLRSKNYGLKIPSLEIVHLPSRYPQGSERALAETFLGRRLGRNESAIQAGILVESAATAFAVYEAVYLGRPLTKRVVTVAGPCVFEPKNLWVEIGTPAADLIRACKGFLRAPERIVFGGPMTGEAVEHLETPITAKTQAVLALPPELCRVPAEEPCIRCGRCVDVCPDALVPETLVRAARAQNFDLAREFEIDACTECGACAYACPSKIPIVDVIRKGKRSFLPETPAPQPADVLAYA